MHILRLMFSRSGSSFIGRNPLFPFTRKDRPQLKIRFVTTLCKQPSLFPPRPTLISSIVESLHPVHVQRQLSSRKFSWPIERTVMEYPVFRRDGAVVEELHGSKVWFEYHVPSRLIDWLAWFTVFFQNATFFGLFIHDCVIVVDCWSLSLAGGSRLARKQGFRGEAECHHE